MLPEFQNLYDGAPAWQQRILASYLREFDKVAQAEFNKRLRRLSEIERRDFYVVSLAMLRAIETTR